MVGLGKYLEKHGYEKRFDIINKHLHKVCQLADNYGLKPMIWSDMFCKLAMDSCDYYALDGNTDAIPVSTNTKAKQSVAGIRF